MKIIPAIDIIDGKCVRLTKGDYAQQKIYNENPVEVAKQFADAGLERLHMVDLDGAKAGKIVNLKVLENVATATSLTIDFGGGVKNINDVGNIFDAGKFLIGADVLDEKIKIGGWLEDAGIDITAFIAQMLGLGVTNIFCTDISKDGVLEGPAVDLYKKIMNDYPAINLVASGGVSNLEDVSTLKELSLINS